MMFYPLFHFFHPSCSFYSNSFYCIENSRICLVLSQKRGTCLFLLFSDLVAVFTAQEEISIFLTNKGQIHVVPIFLLEVHDQFYLV